MRTPCRQAKWQHRSDRESHALVISFFYLGPQWPKVEKRRTLGAHGLERERGLAGDGAAQGGREEGGIRPTQWVAAGSLEAGGYSLLKI